MVLKIIGVLICLLLGIFFAKYIIERNRSTNKDDHDDMPLYDDTDVLMQSKSWLRPDEKKDIPSLPSRSSTSILALIAIIILIYILIKIPLSL